MMAKRVRRGLLFVALKIALANKHHHILRSHLHSKPQHLSRLCEGAEVRVTQNTVRLCGRHQYGAPLRPWRYE
eukprot:6187039-Pleurochrysis_carterae.AAC.1